MSGNIMTTKELPDFYLGIFNMSLLAVFICFVRCYQHTSYSLITSTVLYEIARQNATTIFSIISSIQTALKLFIFLFIFRYLRLVVHIVGWWLYTPASLASSPVFSSSDVTVIVPTVDPAGVSFRECISSVISNDPTLIIIITAGPCPTDDETNFDKLEREWRDHPKIHLMECGVMNKREQLCTALAEVKTPITILCDDHVFWPQTLLPQILAPFSDPQIGIVGTSKRARRVSTTRFSLRSFYNLLGCLYLERNNFDHRATHSLTTLVSTISGRTSAHRTSILQSPFFIHAFLNDYTCFSLIGPLNTDDDKFITRWNISHGWKLGYQDCDATRIEATVYGEKGGSGEVNAKNLRWTRTRWRGNLSSLFGRDGAVVWRQQPWFVYAVYVRSLVNFALLYDSSLIYTLHLSLRQTSFSPSTKTIIMSALALCILASKLVKTGAYFCRHANDLIYLPGCILFGYWHSFIKMYALLTVWKIGWGSRDLGGK